MLPAVSTTDYHAAGEPIVGSLFTAAVGRPAVVPQVTGTAYRTGEHTFVVDPADSLVPGFVLR